MDDESGHDNRNELTGEWGGESRHDLRGWRKESGSWFHRVHRVHTKTTFTIKNSVCWLQSSPKKPLAPGPASFGPESFLECYSPNPSCVTNLLCYIATTAAKVISGMLSKPISLPTYSSNPSCVPNLHSLASTAAKTSKGAKFVGMLPLPISCQFRSWNLFLVWYYPNARFIKFEVTNFNGCRNK